MPGALGKFYASLGGQVSRPFCVLTKITSLTHQGEHLFCWLQVELMGKPALVIYNEALQLLGLEASEVIAIGDSLV
jgi:FMN phosphatase YigB (HAD superfamily)